VMSAARRGAEDSPRKTSQSADAIEMAVTAQNWKAMFTAKSGNPEVIRWNRRSSAFQFQAEPA